MQPRQTHVDQLGVTVGHDEHVGRFDIAMHDVALRSVL